MGVWGRIGTFGGAYCSLSFSYNPLRVGWRSNKLTPQAQSRQGQADRSWPSDPSVRAQATPT